jgi:hypothetical protein
MKPKEVKVGETYEARVDGRYVPVIVVSELPTEEHLNRRFVVRRVGSQRVLSRPRTAGALHVAHEPNSDHPDRIERAERESVEHANESDAGRPCQRPHHLLLVGEACPSCNWKAVSPMGVVRRTCDA